MGETLTIRTLIWRQSGLKSSDSGTRLQQLPSLKLFKSKAATQALTWIWQPRDGQRPNQPSWWCLGTSRQEPTIKAVYGCSSPRRRRRRRTPALREHPPQLTQSQRRSDWRRLNVPAVTLHEGHSNWNVCGEARAAAFLRISEWN